MMRVVLVFDSTENGRTAVEVLEFLGKSGLNGDIYMLYRSNIKITLFKKESEVFTKEGVVASKILDESKKRLENIGLKVKQVKIIFGSVADEISKLEKILSPHLIILGLEDEGFIRRLFQKDECSKILSKTTTPVVVCRQGFEISKVPEICECVKCAVRNSF